MNELKKIFFFQINQQREITNSLENDFFHKKNKFEPRTRGLELCYIFVFCPKPFESMKSVRYTLDS